MIKYEELKEILQKNRIIPYPSIPRLYSNPRYCQMIYDSFGGEKGELTAINQYIYEHISLKNQECIRKILRDIAIEEMRHLDILGDIIIKLGGKPIYQSSNEKMWTSQNIRYDTENLQKIIRKNIEAEEGAILSYQKLIRYTNNMYLRKVYERIILDEKTHIEIFKNILFGLQKKKN